MYRLAFAAFMMLAGTALPALAAPAPGPSQSRIDPAALAAAQRLLGAMDYDRMMQRTVDAMVGNMAPVLKKSLETRTGKPVDDELVRRLTVIQGEFMRSTLINSADMRRAVATIYASKFTAAELDHLASLYKDPVMRKWTDVGPAVAAEMMPLVQGVMESRRGELEQRIKAAVLNYYSEQGTTPSS